MVDWVLFLPAVDRGFAKVATTIVFLWAFVEAFTAKKTLPKRLVPISTLPLMGVMIFTLLVT